MEEVDLDVKGGKRPIVSGCKGKKSEYIGNWSGCWKLRGSTKLTTLNGGCFSVSQGAE